MGWSGGIRQWFKKDANCVAITYLMG